MRLFQNSGVYRSYRPRLKRLTAGSATFDAAIDAFLDDRFGAAHFLKPILDREPEAFFANGDDEFSQRLWAREHGLSAGAALDEILLAQIEHHRTEVFYNMDPMRYGDEFLARLPGSVRQSVAWRAAPSAAGRFLKHDVIVNNFPSLLDQYRKQGATAQYFCPAHDPAMDAYAARVNRPTDVLFIGTYSQHHRKRAALLESIAALGGQTSVVMHLDASRYTRLAETPLGLFGPLRKDRRAPAIRAVARQPVFGRDLLDAIASAKIVVNGAIDMAGPDRGNMRVWEATGCGAALISDAGRYPDHFVAGENFETYESTDELLQKVSLLLEHSDRRTTLTKAAHRMVSTAYSKELQWADFLRLVG